MPQVILTGVRMDDIHITRDGDSGLKLTGSYSLMSQGGQVLATNTINGYQGLKLEMSANSAKAVRELSAVLKTEIDTLLGFA